MFFFFAPCHSCGYNFCASIYFSGHFRAGCTNLVVFDGDIFIAEIFSAKVLVRVTNEIKVYACVTREQFMNNILRFATDAKR